MKLRVIVNPKSGPLKARSRRVGIITSFISRNGLDAELLMTERSGHAGELARKAAAESVDIVVGVGGDGTTNEIATGLIGTNTALALVPCGSGNGLARDLGLPLKIEPALDLLLKHQIKEIDCGKVNDRYFFNVMGFGLDAEIGQLFNESKKRGLTSYVRLSLPPYLRRKKENISIASGGTTTSLPITLLAVANSSQYGNNARIAPGALLDDGYLNITAVKSLALNKLLPFTYNLFTGGIRAGENIYKDRSDAMVITREKPGIIHVDGEIFESSKVLSITTIKRALKLLVP